MAGFTELGGPSFYVGGMSLLSVSPLLWLPVAISCSLIVAVLALRRSLWTWIEAAAATPLAVPRVWIPDAAYLLPGAAMLPRAIDERRRQPAGNRT